MPYAHSAFVYENNKFTRISLAFVDTWAFYYCFVLQVVLLCWFQEQQHDDDKFICFSFTCTRTSYRYRYPSADSVCCVWRIEDIGFVFIKIEMHKLMGDESIAIPKFLTRIWGCSAMASSHIPYILICLLS